MLSCPQRPRVLSELGKLHKQRVLQALSALRCPLQLRAVEVVVRLPWDRVITELEPRSTAEYRVRKCTMKALSHYCELQGWEGQKYSCIGDRVGCFVRMGDQDAFVHFEESSHGKLRIVCHFVYLQ
jgi:hypothetical protein